MTWSRHSRRTDPTSRSANGFCQGDRGAVRISSMPRPWTRGRNWSPKMRSRSRIMNLGAVFLGEGLDDLLGSPGRGRGVGDVEVKNAAAVVGQDEEDIQNAKRRRGNRKEIDRCQRADMVVEEGAPGLRGRLPWLGRHEAGNASLADVDAELQQFAVTSRRAPAHVGLGHLADEPFGLLGDTANRMGCRGATSVARTGESRRGASGPRCLA